MKNKLETDFDLQVRYLYFKINFNFICTAKFLTLSGDGRIYFICIFLDFFGILWEFSIFKVSGLFTLLKSADCLHC